MASSDTPIPRPASRLDKVKSFIGDLARPFSIIVTSSAAAWATVTMAYRVDGFEGAALYIAAVYAGLAGLYGFKAWETTKTGGQAAEVAVAKVSNTPAPGTATIVAAPDVNVTAQVTDTTDDGVLPPDKRVKR
jgi:hypothetical protein